MMLFGSNLKKALNAALKDHSAAAEAIERVSKDQVQSAAEAELVVQVLKLFPLSQEEGARTVGSPLHDVVAWMQGVEDDKATAVFKRLGGPELARVFDRAEPLLTELEDTFRLKTDLMFLLKVLCMYAPDGGLERVYRAARSTHLHDAYLWSVIFDIVASEDHPWQAQIVEALRDPLPRGFAGIAYLDLVNGLARAGHLERHPFDSEPGSALLSGWLSSRDEGEYSYAHSATASVPFLRPDRRAMVQRLAEGHPSRDVQLEAAWAAAKLGEERGLETLQEACADPRYASKAVRYLEELSAEDRIPVHTRSADFKALAEMCEWLAHPQEFGRPPKEIEQADSRELFWPPTSDRRQLWIFRYEYPPNEGETEPDIGYGMVGSETFALFGESTADKTPDEVYALHCAWELEMNEDPRAPEERTIDAGMRILAEHNPGFG